MIKHLLSIFAFMVVSFAVQGFSHFVVNSDHFTAIDFMRSDPIIPLGLFVMVVQGLILTLALTRYAPDGATMRDGIAVSLAFGLFLATYIAIVEPSKYMVPSISSWFLIEGLASLIQFSLFGILLGLIHQKVGRVFSTTDR